MAIYKNVAKSEAEEEESILPPVKENESVKYVSGNIVEKTTKPPTRFTPSTLLQTMKEIHKYVKDDALKAELKECSAIGTEATRAGVSLKSFKTTAFWSLRRNFSLQQKKREWQLRFCPKK